MKRFVGTFLTFATIHYALQATLWQWQSLRLALVGPWATSMEAAGWRYVSFPVFWLLPRGATGASFWLIGGLNSTVRGLFGSVLVEGGRRAWRRLTSPVTRRPSPGA